MPGERFNGQVRWFGVLGPVGAWRDGVELDLGAPQQRSVLAALLLKEGAHLSVDELIATVWGDDPPATAVGTARTYVSRLRRVLQGVIESHAGGYLMPVSAQSFDLASFRRLTARAATARHDADFETASRSLREAIALFRGSPLAGVPGEWAEAQRHHLAELRLAAIEQRLESDLELGRQVEVAAEVWPLIAEHPLREGLRAVQIQALFRSGRRAEALRVYRDVRALMVRDLGIEPGARLQELHGRVLREDPAPKRPVTGGPVQLPAKITDFSGRGAETRLLTDLLTGGDGVPVVGLVGLAGAGKTTLAVAVAHQLRSRFPDGVVYAELGGKAGRRADPAVVLEGFLHAYGVSPGAVPPSLAERAALWRSVLARRRVLVVLDDVADAAQLSPLLPALAGSAVLMTRWRRLPDLPGARWVKLDDLPTADAVTFLERLIGADRVRSEIGFGERLAEVCGHHPAALRRLGVRVQARPSWHLADAEHWMTVALREFDVRHADCAVFYEHILPAVGLLDPDVRAAFRLLAQPDVPDFTVAAAATLLEQPVEECERILEDLVDAHLLEQDKPGRYRFHPMVRLVARSKAVAVNASGPRVMAIERLARFYAAAARSDDGRWLPERDNALAMFGQAVAISGVTAMNGPSFKRVT